MKIDPNQLELLAAVIDHGGVTEGAQFLGKSQPSVSRSIAHLEQRIGEPLFVRGQRPLRPTELGEALAVQGRRVLEARTAASTTLTQFREGKSGLVRVGGTPFFMDGVVTSRIAEFQVANPGVHIQQTYAYAAELESGLRSGTLDIAICPMQRDSLPPGLQISRLLRGRNVIACRSDHPLVRKRNLVPRDIGDYPWVAPPPDSPLFNDLKAALRGIGLKDFQIGFSGGSLNAVLNMVQGSDALSVLPYSVIFSVRKQFAIEPLNVRLHHPERDLCVLRLGDGPPRPAVRRFESYLTKSIATFEATIEHAEKRALWRP